MKLFGKLTFCLAGALAFNAAARAQVVAVSGNPYTVAVQRNIFGLLPPPPPETAPPPPAAPPVKITPNGITDILGRLEVLFKVSGRTPGKEDSYMLTEGESQDDIEVMKIDQKNGIVTFNNHGLVQDIPLVSAPAGSAPVPARTGIPLPVFSAGAIPGGPGFNTAFVSRVENDGGTISDTTSSGGGVIPPPIPTSAPPARQQPAMTAEEQVLAIEVNRELTKQQVLEGTMPPLPPTEITPADATGAGGGPLVIPAPPSP
jgi:hypothetical protein